MEPLEKPARVALLPEKIPFVKPRLKVKIGDKVKVGTPVFEDKRNPNLIFLSPGGGKIANIDLGPRRVIKKVVVALDQDEEYETFPIFTEAQLENIERKSLIKTIMTGGLWPLFKELPFRDVADPDAMPPCIIVSLGANEPFQPVPEAYLKGNIALFEFGIKILQKLSQNLIISTSSENSYVIEQLNSHVTHVCQGGLSGRGPGRIALSY